MKGKKIAVIGAGSWGTALAILLSRIGYQVFLWCHDKEKASAMAKERVTPYLPGINLQNEIKITNNLKEVVEDAGVIFSVVPSKYLRDITTLYSSCIDRGTIIVSCTKGIEKDIVNGTFLRMSQVVSQIIPKARVVALSSPTFAIEVAQGQPTAAVVAGENFGVTGYIQKLFPANLTNFRLYSSTDIIGVELGGALKNIIAIASGICHGLGFGDNTRSALITPPVPSCPSGRWEPQCTNKHNQQQ